MHKIKYWIDQSLFYLTLTLIGITALILDIIIFPIATILLHLSSDLYLEEFRYDDEYRECIELRDDYINNPDEYDCNNVMLMFALKVAIWYIKKVEKYMCYRLD